MRLSIRIDKREYRYAIVNCLLAVFLVTKMQRGLIQANVAGGIWNYIQLLIIFLGVVCFIFQSRPIFKQKSISCLVLYAFLAFIFAGMQIDSFTRARMYSFIMILYPAALLCLYYTLCRKCDCKSIWLISAAFYVIAFLFIRYQIRYYQYGGRKATISNAYYVLTLMPVVAAVTRRKYKIIPFAVTFLALVVSSKRGGMLAFVLALVFYYFIISVQKKRAFAFLRYLVLVAIILAILYNTFTVLDQAYSIGFLNRFRTMLEDGGSGRINRWRNVIKAIKASSIFDLLVGHGDGTLSIAIGNAHNDFLEIAYEEGVITAAVYIWYFVESFFLMAAMARSGYRYAAEFGMTLVISLVLAVVSFFVIEGTFITCSMICQAFFISDWEKQILWAKPGVKGAG